MTLIKIRVKQFEPAIWKLLLAVLTAVWQLFDSCSNSNTTYQAEILHTAQFQDPTCDPRANNFSTAIWQLFLAVFTAVWQLFQVQPIKLKFGTQLNCMTLYEILELII